eukprot:13917383-Ditylum_brightwellii.AAC.1
MIVYLSNRGKEKAKIGNFTKSGPCCTVLNVTTLTEEEVDFNYEFSSTYNHENQCTEGITREKSTVKSNNVTKYYSRVRKNIKTKMLDTYNTDCIDDALHIGQHHLLLHIPIGVLSNYAMAEQKLYREPELLHGCVDAETSSGICPGELKEAKTKRK